MGLITNYLVNFLLYAFIFNHICLPLVTCQDEEITPCVPKRVFLSLLRLPEVSSNLAAYSRTARIIQNAKTRDYMAHSKILIEGSDNSEMCLPVEVYLELLKDPVMRGYFNIIRKTQKGPSLPEQLLDSSGAINSQSTSQKRSIATLAKNDDLPVTIRDRFYENRDDEEKRTVVLREPSERNAPEFTDDQIDYLLTQHYPVEKRNVGSLARDFALPPGRRNIATLVRDYEIQTKGKAETHMLPFAGKRAASPLNGSFTLPQSDKRNIEFINRDYDIPYGKRYIGSLARTGDFPFREQTKRNSVYTYNPAWPVSWKRPGRGLTIPPNVMLKTLSRNGRSWTTKLNAVNEFMDSRELPNLEKMQSKNQESDFREDEKWSAFQHGNGLSGKTEFNNRRTNQQIDFSDKYNTDFDYEETMESLADQYPNAEKRFMGRIPQMGPRPTTPSTRRQGR